MFVEPRALRRRALRLSREGSEGPHGPLQALARRGLRRRGQAPHHDRHVRAVRRLLRRLLPKAQRVRQLINQDFKRAFARGRRAHRAPPRPTSAFGIGAKASDPIQMYLNDIYTIGANLAGVPAMSIPCGFVRDLPVGLQIAGPHFARSEAAQRGACLSEGNGLASPDSRRVPDGGAVMSDSDMAGKPSSASRSTRSCRRSRRSSRARATAYGAAPNSQANLVDLAYPGVLPVLNARSRAHGGEVRPRGRRDDRAALGVRAQELLLPGSAEGLPDQPVRAADRGARATWTSCSTTARRSASASRARTSKRTRASRCTKACRSCPAST